jgi:hypothetical protein
MTNERNGGAIVAIMALALFVVVVCSTMAANNDPPGVGSMINRTRMLWAMGKPLFLLGQAATTGSLTVTGLAVGDHVAGVINLDDTDDAQPALTTLTIAANLLSASGTPFTTPENYCVVVWRPASDGR